MFQDAKRADEKKDGDHDRKRHVNKQESQQPEGDFNKATTNLNSKNSLTTPYSTHIFV